MSNPRAVIPGQTYLLTRRCFERRFFLRPSPKINQIFKFCLAVAASRTGVLLHNYCALSNHYHLVATDPLGTLPEFMHWLNEYVAKCVNAELGRWESFWAPGSYSSVALEDYEDVLGKLEYVFANPVDARLVRTLAEWPGARSLPRDIGAKPETIPRPHGFFRENGPVPESATLELVPPPICAERGPAFLSELESKVAAHEADLRADAKRKGQRYLGCRRVLAQSPFSRPASAEPRRGLNPRVAALDKWRRVQALRRLKGFLAAYRLAWRQFSKGCRTVTFPYGTYEMRVRFGVHCASP